MKIRYLLILFSAFFSFTAFTQITITSADMPDPGDTVRISIASNITSFDYESSGADYTWDFSDLQPLVQQVDTFLNTLETPLAYQVVFIPFLVTNLAQRLISFNFIPNFEVNNAYRYFLKSGGSFNDVGFAFSLNDIPLPVRYDDPDILYKFPLNYMDTYGSLASFQLDVPSLGYITSSRSRDNIVDGWGTIITPNGEFEALRVYSEIDAYDSVYIDSLNLGFPLQRTIREYKWLTGGLGVPVLEVIVDGIVVTANYPDSLRTPFSVPGNEDESAQLLLYPNPVNDKLYISLTIFEDSPVKISVARMGALNFHDLHNASLKSGTSNLSFDIPGHGLQPGLYMLIIKIRDQYIIRKLVVL